MLTYFRLEFSVKVLCGDTALFSIHLAVSIAHQTLHNIPPHLQGFVAQQLKRSAGCNVFVFVTAQILIYTSIQTQYKPVLISCPATLHIIMFFLIFLFVCGYIPLSHPAHIRTHKLDQTKININGFDRAKSAAQVLYGPLLIFRTQQRKTANSNAINKHGSIKELSLCMWTTAA